MLNDPKSRSEETALYAGSFLGHIVCFAIRRPWHVATIWLVACVVGFAGVVDLEIDTGTTSFLDRSGAAWAAYENAVHDFGGDEVIVVAFSSDRRFDEQILEKIERLKSGSRSMAGIRSSRCIVLPTQMTPRCCSGSCTWWRV